MIPGKHRDAVTVYKVLITNIDTGRGYVEVRKQCQSSLAAIWKEAAKSDRYTYNTGDNHVPNLAG